MLKWKSLSPLAGVLLFAGLSAPAWSQARHYMAFFDFEKAAMVPAVRAIVVEIKATLRPNARITLVGHCDTAEKDVGKLCMARALEVQKAFIELGVPEGTQITVVSRGNSQPLVPAGPNTREPQNRRVEITIN